MVGTARRAPLPTLRNYEVKQERYVESKGAGDGRRSAFAVGARSCKSDRGCRRRSGASGTAARATQGADRVSQTESAQSAPRVFGKRAAGAGVLDQAAWRDPADRGAAGEGH